MKLIFPAAYVKHHILKLLLSPPNFLRHDGMSNCHREDSSDLCRYSSATHLSRADTATARERREESVCSSIALQLPQIK